MSQTVLPYFFYFILFFHFFSHDGSSEIRGNHFPADLATILFNMNFMFGGGGFLFPEIRQAKFCLPWVTKAKLKQQSLI